MEGPNSSNSPNDSYTSTSNNFYVVKDLKNTEEQYEMLCNRIKILRLNDERNIKKIENNQNKIQRLQKIRQQAIKSNNNFGEIKKARNQNLQVIKKKNKDLKDSIIKNTQVNLQNIILKRIQNYQQITKQSTVNHKKIQSIKLQSVQQRKAQYNAVALSEQKSKQKKISFAVQKNKSIHEQQAKQNQKLRIKKEKKLGQIQNLEKLQMQMMKKYSQSHIAYKNVKNKLDQMLGKLQHQRSAHKNKNVQQENSNGKSISFYVCNKRNQ